MPTLHGGIALVNNSFVGHFDPLALPKREPLARTLLIGHIEPLGLPQREPFTFPQFCLYWRAIMVRTA